ncbi:MAG: HpcH/HpaI aldolase family protein [Eubacteriales bacterium]
MIRKNKLKELLNSGSAVIGTFVTLIDPAIVEILGLMGFDFVVIDNEHVAMDRTTVVNMIRASEMICSDIVPIVRIKDSSTIEIAQMLDSGALGLQIPGVDTYDQTKNIVDAAYYAPIGHRGLGTAQRGIGYGAMEKFEYFKTANEEILTIIQCESIKSVKNLNRILEIDEIDIVFIGAMDLSQSMGTDIMGRRNHPDLIALFNETVKKITAAGKIAGGAAGSMENVHELYNLGVRYFTISNDISFLKASASQILKSFKNIC